MKINFALASALIFSSTVIADEKSPWHFSVELGLESDSNVVVEDVERNSAADNLNQQSRISLGYSKKTKDKLEFGGSYSYFNKDYRSLDDFDSDMHMLNLKASKKFDQVKVGVNAIYVEADLNDDAFVVYKQVTPNLSYFINKKNFIYASYQIGKKAFEELVDRSADQQALSLNFYHLFRGLNNYLTAGVSYKDEEAEELFYGYKQLEFKLAYTYRSKLLDFPTRLKLSYRHQRRDYDSDIHPILDDFRLDKRNQLKLNYKVTLPHDLYTEFEVTGNMNTSNLEAADYDQTKVGVLVGYQFK